MFRTRSISDLQQGRGGELPKAILPAGLPKAGIDLKTQRPLRQEGHHVVMSRRPDLSPDVSGSQIQNAGQGLPPTLLFPPLSPILPPPVLSTPSPFIFPIFSLFSSSFLMLLPPASCLYPPTPHRGPGAPMPSFDLHQLRPACGGHRDTLTHTHTNMNK